MARCKTHPGEARITAKKQKVYKTKKVYEYLKVHPTAGNTEISVALKKQGITINPQHVANIKSKLKAEIATKKVAAAAPMAVVAERPAPAQAAPEVVEKPGNTITLAQIKKVAETVRMIGGLGRLKELLAVIREVGGPKKFKDLLDAMSIVDTEAGKP